ncbi:uncharacterized protein LOC108594661 [Drosophila busckii]|uniref:uncharacterized protein LOC108594661 n=1 Tax=Drosophila busckii TaxID=30019 RepID=UPI00083EDFF0|nr:uncharacterized protein LOC108594661 [Drosophila busckii]
MYLEIGLSLVLLLGMQPRVLGGLQLSEVLDELNARLGISTNLVYAIERDKLNYLEELQPTSQMIVASLHEFDFNVTGLMQHLNERLMLVIIANDPAHAIVLLEKLELKFQKCDLLLVTEADTESWLEFAWQAWELGYMQQLMLQMRRGEVENISDLQGFLELKMGLGYLQQKLMLQMRRGEVENIYGLQGFPELKMQESTLDYFIEQHERLTSDLRGKEIRVAIYTNPPRCLCYEDANGGIVYGGYYMRFLRHFLGVHNASFVPVRLPSDSPQECISALLERRVDVCPDALAQGADRKFVVTNAIRLAYANIMVANAQPLSSYRYLVAPFSTQVWCCLLVYVVLMVCFMSFVHWRQQGSWLFSKFLLEAISSLLFAGFTLKDLRARERCILFPVLFIAGFIYSTFYLGYLKSILATEVFGEQINSFEQLIESNVSIMIDDYDRTLSLRYKLPDLLWPNIQVVSDDTLKRHRNNFDQHYAYILFSDRMELYDYAQQYLRHPHVRRIPINIFFLYAGFPMRESWYLKQTLSTAWALAFDSGLLKKLALDADHETMTSSVGFLQFQVTEYYEATPLGLDYFVMPAMSLALGLVVALLAFVLELLLAWRNASHQIDCSLDRVTAKARARI